METALHLRRAALGLVALLGIGVSAPAGGEEEGDLEDILGAFEDEDPEFAVDMEAAESVGERGWDFSGSYELSGSINYLHHRSDTGTNYTGLQRLRNRLNLQFDARLSENWEVRLEGWGFYDLAYAIEGKRHYTHEVLDVYQRDAEVGEAWIRGSPHPNLDIKLGRQVVIWGRSETLRVLDVLNPLDNREPGRADLEDLRLPVTMARVDGYLGDWSLSLMGIPEMRPDKNPVVGSDFYPGSQPIGQEEPKAFRDWEAAGALTGIFSGWDLSFHGAWYWDDQPRFQPGNPDLVHDRLYMLGVGGNFTTGSWLFKYEFGYVNGLGFSQGPKRNRFDAFAGVEYYGFSDTTIVLEVLNRHLLSYDSALLQAPNFTRRNTQEIALRVSRNFWNDRLHITGVGFLQGWDARDGAVARIDIDYDLADALQAGVGVLTYWKGDLPPLSDWGRNDRILFKFRWSF